MRVKCFPHKLQNGDIELVPATPVLDGQEPQKVNVRFEISNFQIVYRQDFVKIKKFILFDPKCPYLGIWAQNSWKPMSDLNLAHSKWCSSKVMLRFESLYFLTQNVQIRHSGSKFSKNNVRFQIRTFGLNVFEN